MGLYQDMQTGRWQPLATGAGPIWQGEAASAASLKSSKAKKQDEIDIHAVKISLTPEVLSGMDSCAVHDVGMLEMKICMFIGQVYKGVLNRSTDVAVKTFSHQGTAPEVIRFNAVSKH